MRWSDSRPSSRPSRSPRPPSRDGVPRDAAEGLEWLYLSHDAEDASRFLSYRLEGEVGPEVLAEGRRRAEAWRRAHAKVASGEP